jgi:flagellar basal-body rod modification protein FlgD
MLPAEIASATALPEPVQTKAGELGRQDFLRMLIAQLENQDPLNPQDATEFTAQLAQFSGLEQLLAMRTALEAFTRSQSTVHGLSAVGLIGRRVVVEGAQFEIRNGEPPPALFVELPAAGTLRSVEVLDANGAVVARGTDAGLRPAGRSEILWSRFDRVPPPGVYSLRLQGDGAEVPTPLVEARVTGAGLSGASPVLFLGDAVAPLSAVREVRE